MINKQKKFLRSEFWIMSWNASMPRHRKLYKSKAKDSEKIKFKKGLIKYCEEKLLPQYETEYISAGDHRNNIVKLQKYANDACPCSHVLWKSRYNIGVAQNC